MAIRVSCGSTRARYDQEIERVNTEADYHPPLTFYAQRVSCPLRIRRYALSSCGSLGDTCGAVRAAFEGLNHGWKNGSIYVGSFVFVHLPGRHKNIRAIRRWRRQRRSTRRIGGQLQRSRLCASSPRRILLRLSLQYRPEVAGRSLGREAVFSPPLAFML
jgi:hypothetical protein